MQTNKNFNKISALNFNKIFERMNLIKFLGILPQNSLFLNLNLLEIPENPVFSTRSLIQNFFRLLGTKVAGTKGFYVKN